MLRYRIVSALVLVPLALLTVYLGAPVTLFVAAAAAAIMSWEWDRITEPGLPPLARGALVGVVGLSLMLSWVWSAWWAPAIVACCVVLRARVIGQPGPRLAWSLIGVLWLVGAAAGFLWLRATPHGFMTTLWALLLVWAEDTAAFLFGRALGGPRLAPTISPNKTWAGLAAGIAAGIAVSVVLAFYTDPARPFRLVSAAVCLAILEQMGDMAESHAKRRFGVKDSSGLIPGHGGLLDRLDGMMAVVYGLVALELLGAETW